MYKLLKVELLVTEHRQEASPQVAAMDPSIRGCFLPSELPKELPDALPKELPIEMPTEGNNEENIDVLPSDTKYKDASCRLKKKIRDMVG